LKPNHHYKREAGNPYLALAMLIQAGLSGVREQRAIETEHPHALPGSLGEALELLERSAAAAEWLGPEVHAAYLLFKRAEIKAVQSLDEGEICRRYMEAY